METLLRLLLEQQLINYQLNQISTQQKMNLARKLIHFLGNSRAAKTIKKELDQLVKEFGDWLIINPDHDGTCEWYSQQEYYNSFVKLPTW